MPETQFELDDFLRAAASVAASAAVTNKDQPSFPERVTIPSGTTVATERYVASDTPESKRPALKKYGLTRPDFSVNSPKRRTPSSSARSRNSCL